MFTVSELFKQYVKLPSREFDVKAVINDVTYDNTSVINFDIEDIMLADEEFTLGTVISSKLTIPLKTTNVIPSNAKVTPFIRLNGASGWTEWIPLGSYFIDNRLTDNGLINLTCFDRIMYSEQKYVSGLTYPTSTTNVLNEVCGIAGITLDSSVVLAAQNIQIAPTGYTLRQVLGYIAGMNCGSWKMTKDDKLMLVKFISNPVRTILDTTTYSAAKQTNPARTYTKLTVEYDDDGNSYSSGVGNIENTLFVVNPFVTQAIVNNMFGIINNFSYVPFTMEWKDWVYIETGDALTITMRDSSNINTVLLTNKMSFRGGIKSVATAPGISDQNSEFAFSGGIAQQTKNAVKQGRSYFGVTITKEDGLKVEKSDGASEATFNSDVFEMNAKDSQGVMRKRIYFDPVAGNYIFDGLLSATAIEAISAEIDVVISNTVIVNNLYSEYGRIANLTVSELNTGWQKITNFLANNKAPVFYKRDYEQYSMYYEAVTDGTEDPNTLTDRDGNLLYWVDNTYKGMTLANTGLPVKTYKYTEYLKMEISFRDVDGVTRPRIIMGAGYGNPSFPERGKFIIDKHVDGGLLEYITANGTRYSIEIGENGILQNGVELLSAIDFYSNGFTATYGGTIAGYRWTKDGTGKIMQLTNIHTSETVPVTWGGGSL